MNDGSNNNNNYDPKENINLISSNTHSMTSIFDRLGKDSIVPLYDVKCLNNNNNNFSTDNRNIIVDKVIETNIIRNPGSISTDHILNGDIGYSFIVSDKLIGRGSYGEIYLATDENKREVAVKCCNIDEGGIPNILEASIMGSMIHPYLNRAHRILASDTKLYIIQELAQTDLAQYTRIDKGNHKPGIDELRRWSYCIVQALAALHIDNIIHADIKASNILLYNDGSVKLTDYTLATKKWTQSEKFNHNVCTCTHRPLECLMRRPWDESLDIWSLGCTLYEIAYGELLFPYQGVLEPDQKIKDKDAKTRLRNRSVNAIIDWSSRGPNPPSTFEAIGTPQFPIDYIPFILCGDFRKQEMSVFNHMICQMLTVDPAQRPTVHQILAHPFFHGIKAPIYLSVKRPINKISVSEQARASRYIQRYTSDDIIEKLALNMYCQCNDLNTISEHIKAAVCTWISSKIVLGYPPKLLLPLNQILSAEREICHNLLFRLH
jgi:serine/threonine protein kinase